MTFVWWPEKLLTDDQEIFCLNTRHYDHDYDDVEYDDGDDDDDG